MSLTIPIQTWKYQGNFNDFYPLELTGSPQTASLGPLNLYLSEVDVTVLLEVTTSAPLTNTATIQSFTFHNVPTRRAFQVHSASVFIPCLAAYAPNYYGARAQAAGYTLKLKDITSVGLDVTTVQDFIHWPLSSSL